MDVQHEVAARQHMELADNWANRDGVIDREHRAHMIDYHLRLAQIHATLAVAQQLSLLPLPALA